MSSDIVFCLGKTTLEESCGAFFGMPFREICRRIHHRAVELGCSDLEIESRHAVEDDWLNVSDLEEKSLMVVIEVAQSVLGDPSFYAYENEFRGHKWFEDACQRAGNEPEEFLADVRDSTKWQLGHLIVKLQEKMEMTTS